MNIDMEIAAESPVLTGAISGKAVFASLLQMMEIEPEEPEPLFMNFGNVDIATASFLREAVFVFKNFVRSSGSPSKFYPVIANANSTVLEELEIIAEAKNDAILACQLSEDGNVSDVRVIGNLDPKQALTFDLVTEKDNADAASLMAQYGASEKTTRTTAWNNRLSSLAARGLIREYSRGRSKFYRPLFAGVA